MSGYLVSVSSTVTAFEIQLHAPFASHPDMIEAEDEFDLLDFLEERAAELFLPAPERVVYIGKGGKDVRGLPAVPSAGYYALWSISAWSGSEKLRHALVQPDLIGPVTFQFKYPRWVPAGAGLLFWLLSPIVLLLLLRGIACI